MVMGSHVFGLDAAVLLAAREADKAVIEQLKPEVRLAVVMALLGLTLVGLFLITFVMVGGHWVRRLARQRPGRRRFGKHFATESGLREALQEILPEGNSNDTVLLNTSSKETKVDT
jgi:hypothetical protein